MNTMIYLAPGEIWEYFCKDPHRKDHNVVVAENDDTGFSIEMSDVGSLPYLTVYDAGHNLVFGEPAIDSLDTLDVATDLYAKYILVDPDIDSPIDEDEVSDLSDQEMEDLVYLRDDEISLAMQDLLEVLLRGTGGEHKATEIEVELTDEICTWLAKKWDLSVYRPSFYEDDDGNEVFYTHPYDSLVVGKG